MTAKASSPPRTPLYPKSPRSPRVSSSVSSPRATPLAQLATEMGMAAGGEGVQEGPSAEMLRHAKATTVDHTAGIAGAFTIHVSLGQKDLDRRHWTLSCSRASHPAHARSYAAPHAGVDARRASSQWAAIYGATSRGRRLDGRRAQTAGAVQCVVDNQDGTYTVTMVASCSGEYRVIASDPSGRWLTSWPLCGASGPVGSVCTAAESGEDRS